MIQLSIVMCNLTHLFYLFNTTLDNTTTLI